MLKVFNPDHAATMPPERTRTDARPEPMPILSRMIGHDIKGEPHVDTVRVWSNEDAARCHACPASECTFAPDVSGIGSCITRRKGKIGESTALLLS